jgi:uncharacterized protein
MNMQVEQLKGWFAGKGRVLVAVSGGVDSALVAYAAHAALGSDSAALTADYKTLSQDELDSARQVCSQIGIQHTVISYSELDDEGFVANDRDRCFHCRTQLGRRLQQFATEGSFQIVVDGTNLDDLGDFRPGIEALRGYHVRSPLLETGFAKSDVRAAAMEAGLAVHDRPSNSCLASRIPWGQRVTAGSLERIELGEDAVKRITGARTVRVRDIGGTARIELGADELALLSQDARLEISRKLKSTGFSSVEFDPEGYRQGKANVMSG